MKNSSYECCPANTSCSKTTISSDSDIYMKEILVELEIWFKWLTLYFNLTNLRHTIFFSLANLAFKTRFCPAYINLLRYDFQRERGYYSENLGEKIKHFWGYFVTPLLFFLLQFYHKKPSATTVLGCTRQCLFVKKIHVKECQRFWSQCGGRWMVVC